VFLQPFIIKRQQAKIVHAYKKTIEYKTIGINQQRIKMSNSKPASSPFFLLGCYQFNFKMPKVTMTNKKTSAEQHF